MPTVAWLSLLSCMDPDGLRELLGEGGARECHQRGVRDLADREAWPCWRTCSGIRAR